MGKCCSVLGGSSEVFFGHKEFAHMDKQSCNNISFKGSN